MRSHTLRLPRVALPPSWEPTENTNAQIAYRRGHPPIEVIAIRTSADHTHPLLGVDRCWELRFRYSVGEVMATDTIGRVPTRRAALDGLLQCMREIHDRLQGTTDPRAVSQVLEGVSDRGWAASNPYQ